MRWVVLIFALGWVASCGQQGPLVLPEDAEPQSVSAVPASSATGRVAP